MSGPPQQPDTVGIFAAMAGPAVLLLANAMLILSTIQRLQAVLTRIHENELRLSGTPKPGTAGLFREELLMHGRRVRLAHRALFAFYAAAAVLLTMIGAAGAGAAGWKPGAAVALACAFAGAALLLTGTALLTAETWVGMGATDRRVKAVVSLHAIGEEESPSADRQPES